MLVVLCGSNNFLIRDELNQRVTAFAKANGELAIEKFDGDEANLGEVSSALQNMPFLASRKLVVVRNFGNLFSGLKDPQDFFTSIPEWVELIIVEPNIDKRTVYYKTLKNFPDFHEFNAIDSFELAAWAKNYAKDLRAVLGDKEARWLVERVGANQQNLANEIAKLAAYDPKITIETITNLTDQIITSSVFELLDTALRGDMQRALTIYGEQRTQGVEPTAMIGLLAWQLHILALLTAAGDRSLAQISEDSGISSYPLSKSQNLAKRLGRGGVKQLLEYSLAADRQIKTQNVDSDEVMKLLIVKIANSAT